MSEPQGSNEPTGWKRVGFAVKKRRLEVGLRRQRDLADKVGVDVRVINDIETGRRETYSIGTILQLERNLGWDDGSIEAIRAGGEPTLLRLSSGAHLELTAGGMAAADHVQASDRVGPRPVGSSLDAAADEAGLTEEERAAYVALIRATRRHAE